MGETSIRNDISYGDGVYKSEDAGKTWKHMGLKDTRHISRIRIHPEDPGVVYAASLGHIYGPSSKTGVFRSEDGGETWEELKNGLPKGMKGRIGVAVSPVNPERIWALIEADGGGRLRFQTNTPVL